MKISKWINIDQEIEVDISAEDIEGIFAKTPDCESIVMTLISRFHSVMKVTKDETIAKIDDKNKAIIRDFLLKLADRFNIVAN